MKRLLAKICPERGFSLIEVVASIVIITILLVSFSQLFVQANKTAAYNNEKLVTINLADAVLAKLRSETFTKNPTITDMNDYFKEPTNIDPSKRKIPIEIQMNGQTYSISYKASQSGDVIKNSIFTEQTLDLIKVVVTVSAPNGKIKGSTEGYVVLE